MGAILRSSCRQHRQPGMLLDGRDGTAVEFWGQMVLFLPRGALRAQ